MYIPNLRETEAVTICMGCMIYCPSSSPCVLIWNFQVHYCPWSSQQHVRWITWVFCVILHTIELSLRFRNLPKASKWQSWCSNSGLLDQQALDSIMLPYHATESSNTVYFNTQNKLCFRFVPPITMLGQKARVIIL